MQTEINVSTIMVIIFFIVSNSMYIYRYNININVKTNSRKLALKMLRKGSFLLLLVFVNTFWCTAHVGEHSLIKLYDGKITENPKNPELYLKRGSQHRYAGHFELALKDFAVVRTLEPDNPVVNLDIGLVFLDRGWYKTSEYYLRRFLNESPGHIVGSTSLAKALAGQGRGAEAAKIYSTIFEKGQKLSPEFYMQWADFYLLVGNKHAAVKCLDKGVGRLGDITSLHQKALQIETELDKSSAKLKRLEKLVANSPQKEKWLYSIGQVCESEGRYKEAKQSYLQALEYYNRRPQSRRSAPALVEIKNNLDFALDRLQQKL